MTNRPIHNEEDGETALEEIEALWEAEPGTVEGVRLDVLVMLVEAYEAEHYPISAPDPIELIAYHIIRAILREIYMRTSRKRQFAVSYR